MVDEAAIGGPCGMGLREGAVGHATWRATGDVDRPYVGVAFFPEPLEGDSPSVGRPTRAALPTAQSARELDGVRAG
jgi:hypothetical protein